MFLLTFLLISYDLISLPREAFLGSAFICHLSCNPQHTLNIVVLTYTIYTLRRVMGNPMEPVQHRWSLDLINHLDSRTILEFWSRWMTWTVQEDVLNAAWNMLEGWDIGSQVTVQTWFVWIRIDCDNIRSLLGTLITRVFCWISKINVPLPETLLCVPT